GNLLQRVAFVVVDPAFHRHDSLTGEPAADEPAGVRHDRRVREVRDVLVAQRCLDRDLLDQPAQAGAEDNADARLARPLGPNSLARFLNLVEELQHPKNPLGRRWFALDARYPIRHNDSWHDLPHYTLRLRPCRHVTQRWTMAVNLTPQYLEAEAEYKKAR